MSSNISLDSRVSIIPQNEIHIVSNNQQIIPVEISQSSDANKSIFSTFVESIHDFIFDPLEAFCNLLHHGNLYKAEQVLEKNAHYLSYSRKIVQITIDNDDPKSIKFLIRHGFDISFVEKEEMPSTSYAVIKKSALAFATLIEDSTTPLDLTSKKGQTVLHIIAERNDLQSLELISKKRADEFIRISEKQNQIKQTAAAVAIRLKHFKLLDVFIEGNIATLDNREIIQILIEKKEYKNFIKITSKVTAENMTNAFSKKDIAPSLIFYIADQKNSELLTDFIKIGLSSVVHPKNKKNILHVLVDLNDAKNIVICLETAKRIFKKTDSEDFFSPFVYAKDANGDTPVILAVKKNHVESLKALLEGDLESSSYLWEKTLLEIAPKNSSVRKYLEGRESERMEWMKEKMKEYYTWFEEEFLPQVFSFLSGKHLIKCFHVSRSWREIADRNESWFHACKNDIPESLPSTEFNKDYKFYKDLYKAYGPWVFKFSPKQTGTSEMISLPKYAFKTEGVVVASIITLALPILLTITGSLDIGIYISHKISRGHCACSNCNNMKQEIRKRLNN